MLLLKRAAKPEKSMHAFLRDLDRDKIRRGRKPLTENSSSFSLLALMLPSTWSKFSQAKPH